ncbi:hypothetical protein BDZ45DRAFT_757404 [Acephala macrosclerotiorum]|nr:hypothetical protein BDZ45DRAFT_757404 [Acephala macrosclerotiorum]
MSVNQLFQSLENISDRTWAQLSDYIAEFKLSPQGTKTLVELKETLAQDQECLARLIQERRDFTKREKQVLADARLVGAPRQNSLLERLAVVEGIMTEEEAEMANLRRMHERTVNRDFQREVMFEIEQLAGRRFSREQARIQIEVELTQSNAAFTRHTQEYDAMYEDIDRKIEEVERVVQRAKQLIDEDIVWYRDQCLRFQDGDPLNEV